MDRAVGLLAVALCGSVMLWAADAASEIYEWIDQNGELHAVSSLDEVPQQYKAEALAAAEERGGGSISFIDSDDSETEPTPRSVPAAPRATRPGASPPESNLIAGHDEFWWRSQARERREAVERLDEEIEAAREDEENGSDQIYHRPDPDGGRAAPRSHRHRRRAAALSAEYDTDEPTLEEIEESAADAKEELSQFEYEARRAGVPPGWLR